MIQNLSSEVAPKSTEHREAYQHCRPVASLTGLVAKVFHHDVCELAAGGVCWNAVRFFGYLHFKRKIIDYTDDVGATGGILLIVVGVGFSRRAPLIKLVPIQESCRFNGWRYAYYCSTSQRQIQHRFHISPL